MPPRLLHYADVENAFDAPDRVGRLVGAVDARGDPSTLVTGGGDNTAPGVLSLVTGGRHARLLFDAVDPDVDVFGNHDFDHGLDAIRETVAESPQTWLAANLTIDGERFAADAGARDRALVGTPEGAVGFVGVTTPALREMNPGAAPVSAGDPVAAVREHVPALRDAGADRVVVLSHCGVAVDEEIARETDADAVLGGHDHEELVERVAGTLVVHPGQGGRLLLEVDLGGDRPSATRHDTGEFPRDGAVAEAVRAEVEAAGLDEVVARWEEPVPLDDRARKRGESAVGNLVTDAHRWRTDADCALAIAGVRQDDPLEGEVTVADLVGLVPYGNDLAVCELSGKRLAEALRELSATYRYPEAAPNWYFGHVSGVRLVYDDRAESLVEATVGGDPLDPDATYEVAASRYFVESDHLFSAFGPDDVARAAGREHAAIVEYVRERPERPAVDGRIRRPNLEAEPVDR